MSVAMADRFRGYLPVVVDLEMGGLDPSRHALLEVAASIVRLDEAGRAYADAPIGAHVMPAEGLELDPKSMEINGIDVDHPLRLAVDEKQALTKIFKPIREAMKAAGCNRAIMVAHNPMLDLAFVQAACARSNIKRVPFHPFSTFDTATLAGLAYGQTVLSRAVVAAGIDFDSRQAHSARYDCEVTAALFCEIVNSWHRKIGIPSRSD